MMHLRTLTAWTTLLLAISLYLGACAGAGSTVGEPSTNEPTNTEPTNTEPTNTEPTNTEPAPTYALSFVETGELTVHYGSETPIAVKLTRNGQAFANQTIRFEAFGEIGTLLVSEATTDASGIASVTLRASTGKHSGSLRALDVAGLSLPVVRAINVIPRPAAKLEVVVGYKGLRNLPSVTLSARVVDPSQAPDCESLFDKPLDPQTMVRTLDSLPQTATFDEIPNGTTLMIVATAKNVNDRLVAAGCLPQVVTIVDGQAQTIELDLDDIAPLYSGTYDVVYELDLISTLPPSAKGTVETVINTIQNPGDQMTTWLCEIDGLSSLCSNSIIKAVVSSVLTSVIQSLIKQNPQLSSVYFGANDVTKILKKFNLLSVVDFDDEPDDQGRFESGKNRERFAKLRFQWTYQAGCDPTSASCGISEYPVSGWGIQTTAVDFDASIRELESIDIEPHTFKFSYGQLLAGLIERVVLPRVMGNPKINSFQNFFYELLGGQGCLDIGSSNCCTQFGLKAAESEWADYLPVQSMAELACELLVPYGADQLREQFTKLDPAGLDGLIIATPAKSSCGLRDTRQLMEIDRIGTEGEPCTLDARIKIGEDYYPVNGTFYGTRRLK